jgi:transposase-like protein
LKPIDLETRSAIVKAVQKGARRSAVARQFNVSPSTVARVCREAGIIPKPLTPGQQHSRRMATDAVKLETRRRRMELSLRLLEDAEKLRKQLWQPWTAYDFGGGGENYGFHQHQLKQPDARSQRDICIALAVCVDKSIALEKLDDGSTNTVKAAIVSLIDRLETAELETPLHVVDS